MRIEESAQLKKEELEKLYSSSLILADEEYTDPPQIIWVDGSTIATLGNFSASTGKAKSKKTYNISALAAASLTNKQVLRYRARLPENKRKILYVDTEQSHYHCHVVMKRILKLAGLPDNENCDNLKFIGLREYSPFIRIQIIEYALCRDSGFGLVIIDGIRDLMLDINNPSESVNLINKLMQWSSHYNLHIHCVLHLNKGDDNVRGHIGTELSNKAETVLVINKSRVDSAISEVRPLNIRDKEFSAFAFKIKEDGMPANVDEYSSESGMEIKKRLMISDLTDEQHREALKAAFGRRTISGYENVVAALNKGYATVGFNRGRTLNSRLLTLALTKGFIKKSGTCDYRLSDKIDDIQSDSEYQETTDEEESDEDEDENTGGDYDDMGEL